MKMGGLGGGLAVTAKNAVVERIRTALNVRFEYASRSDKPNEPFDDFQRVIRHVSVRASHLRWSARESGKGKLAVGAEDQVFEATLTVTVLGRETKYYCKGFFAPKGSADQGVEIQSFRREG